MDGEQSLSIDLIVEDILEGKTFRQIAEKYAVSLGKIHGFLHSDEHSARAREALEISSDTYADKAEQVLIDAPKDFVEIQRARELSQFYKWKASKRAPKKYGDKVDVTSDGKQLQSAVVYLPDNGR